MYTLNVLNILNFRPFLRKLYDWRSIVLFRRFENQKHKAEKFPLLYLDVFFKRKVKNRCLKEQFKFIKVMNS